MSITNAGPRARRTHLIAVEFALVTTVLVGLYLWRRLVVEGLAALFGPAPAFGGLLLSGLVTGGLLVGGLVVLAGGYVAFRDIEIGLALPSRDGLPSVAVAGAVPALLVGVTKLVGTVTGVPYNSLTMTAVAADALAAPVLLMTGLGVLVSVPVLVVICQVLVQGSFERVLDGDAAVVVTTLVTGFVMASSTGGLATVPDEGRLLGAVLFAPLLGLALYAYDRLDRDRLRYLAYAPALAYASLLLANRAVVVLLEAGMRSW